MFFLGEGSRAVLFERAHRNNQDQDRASLKLSPLSDGVGALDGAGLPPAKRRAPTDSRLGVLADSLESS